MAGRRTNGRRRKSTADLTLEMLGKIHAEMTGMRGEVRGVRDGLDQTNQRLDQPTSGSSASSKGFSISGAS